MLGLFGRKKEERKEVAVEEIGTSENLEKKEISTEDLIMAKLESIDARLKNVERMLEEIYRMAKS